MLAAYRAAAREAGVAALRVVATAAVRAAAGNREEFLDRAEAALGVRPEVISGEEEAVLSFEGATGGIAGPVPYLVIDVGGGSTEFVFGTAAPESVASVDLGSRRVTERYLPGTARRPGEVAAARRAAADGLRRGGLAGRAGRRWSGWAAPTPRWRAIALGLPAYDPEQGPRGGGGAGRPWTPWWSAWPAMSLEEIAALPSLDPARAPVLLGGAIVARRGPAAVGEGRGRGVGGRPARRHRPEAGPGVGLYIEGVSRCMVRAWLAPTSTWTNPWWRR